MPCGMWHVAVARCAAVLLTVALIAKCCLFFLPALSRSLSHFGPVLFCLSLSLALFPPLSLSLSLLCLKHTFRQFTYFVKQPQLTDRQTDSRDRQPLLFHLPPPSHSFSSASSSSCCVCLLRRVAFLLLQSNCVLLFFNFFKLLLFALSLVSLSSLSLFLSLPLSLPSCSVGKQIIC